MTAPTFPNVLVVGMHFRGQHAKAAVESFLPPLELQLEREPRNPHDEFAIKVLYNGEHIGYVERGQAAFISPRIDEGQKYRCTVTDLMKKHRNLHPVCTIEPDDRPDESEEDYPIDPESREVADIQTEHHDIAQELKRDEEFPDGA